MKRILAVTFMLALMSGAAQAGSAGAPVTPVEPPRRPALRMGSSFVPLDSWVYPAFERLAALGYMHSGMQGMKPWTRRECARLVEEVEQELWRRLEEPAEPARLYRALAREFAEEMEVSAGGDSRRTAVEELYTRSVVIAGEPLRDGYFFGQTISNDFGRPYGRGFNAVSGLTARASGGPFALFVRAEHQYGSAGPELPAAAAAAIEAQDLIPGPPAQRFGQTSRPRLVEGYVAFALGGWQLTAGKQALSWGPGKTGALTLGYNADPLPMVRGTRTMPLVLPGFLRLMGPIRTEFFIGRLSGHTTFNRRSTQPNAYGYTVDPRLSPQPFIHGQKLSFKPTPNFEFGVSRTAILAGDGFPLTWRSFYRSMFSNFNEVGGNDPGDRRSGVDFSYRLPYLRNWVTLYNDSMADDEISPLGFPRRSAMNPGIYMPRLPKLPKVDLRVEAAYTDLPGLRFVGFFYFNPRYRNGYVNDGNLVGSPAGRQGRLVEAKTTYWNSPENTIHLRYRATVVNKAFLSGGRIHDVEAGSTWALPGGWHAAGSLQLERWEFPLLRNSAQVNAAAKIQLTYRPQWKLK